MIPQKCKPPYDPNRKAVALVINNYNEVGRVVHENTKTCLLRLENVPGCPTIKKKKKDVRLLCGAQWN